MKSSTPRRFGALSQLGTGDYIGIYADADHFAEVINVARLVQNERILQGMPDGVVLLDNDNTILWGNGRLREWTGREDVVGSNFYDVMGTPEILGPDFCPFHTALATGRAERLDAAMFSESLHASPRRPGDRCGRSRPEPGRHHSRGDRRSSAAAKALGHSPGRHRAGRPDARRSLENVGRGADRAVAGQHPALHAGCSAIQRRRNPHARSEHEGSRAGAGRRHDGPGCPTALCVPIRTATA